MNREQCKGCAYFMAAGGGEPDSIKFCHYMLRTGQRRKVGENEICLSRTPKSRRACPPFVVPAQQA